MQFIPNGPDIPERLLQAHEDGRVVFFCGAGISYPAGLPGFSELVDKVFKALNHDPDDAQEAEIRAERFDTAIDLLEKGIVGKRNRVRKKIAEILTPNLDISDEMVVAHEALLTLGKFRDDSTRLVTTNFDRLFEEVIAKRASSDKHFQAPKRIQTSGVGSITNHWDGLVYLHGLLTTDPTPHDLNELVISSGDFGNAYLKDGWAARFVSDKLFRDYNVCFVGYSINDPMLRYMTDALASDRLQGESPLEIFAFGSHSEGEEKECSDEWLTKNVTPILYLERDSHLYLYETLKAWAETYRDGVDGKERIVVECAKKDPLKNTKQDDFIGCMLWALSDPSGQPAKRFATLNPVPSLDWLEPLSEQRFRHADLNRFGVPPETSMDDDLKFSLIQRPSPGYLAPLMTVADGGARHSRWDKVMWGLAHWLTRHLNDPTLLLWLANRGGQLHDDLIKLIEIRLKELTNLEHGSNEVRKERNKAEMKRILEDAPNAIPSPSMRILWQLLLTGRVKSPVREFALFQWVDNFKRDGFTTILRLNLREILTPCVSLHGSPSRKRTEDGESDEPMSIAELVGWEVKLSTTDPVHSCIDDLSTDELWAKALPELLSDFSTLLRDALDLMRELGAANNKSDLSFMQQPSIDEHSQNRNHFDWTALIRLTRDAWLALSAQSPKRAVREAENWQDLPYPLFRRLSFFAAAQGNVIPLRQALDWLLAEEHRWLWSIETHREAIRLLVILAPQLDKEMLAELEQAVLAGPPPDETERDISPEDRRRATDREIWLRLAKIHQTGASLSEVGKQRLDALSAQNPARKLKADQSDEFPYWMSSGWVDYDDEDRNRIATPQRRSELTAWLKQHPTTDRWQEDDWRLRCRNNFSTTTCALFALAKEGNWPTDRWRIALQAWSEEEPIKRSWRYMAPVIASAPDEVIHDLGNDLSRWLRAIAKTVEGHEELFLLLTNRILKFDYQEGIDTDDPLTRAINHPIGRVSQALLDWWIRKPLKDEQGLPDELYPIFTKLCDTHTDKYWHGRIVLASRVITLFRVDPAWTRQHLLPLFDWQRDKSEARSAWAGFLWSPQLYRPFMEEIKPYFIDTAQHYTTLEGNDQNSLGEHGQQYARILTFTALVPGDTFTISDMKNATHALPQAGLDNAAQALVQALEEAGDQRAEYWVNKVAPYLDKIWPKTEERRSPNISECFARLCVAAGKAFPEAFNMLEDWLQPPKSTHFIALKLYEAGLCRQFPEPSLAFLDLVVDISAPLRAFDLDKCLKEILEAEPALEGDQRYKRLSNYLRRYQ